MPRSVAVAYGIAGLSVAIALIAMFALVSRGPEGGRLPPPTFAPAEAAPAEVIAAAPAREPLRPGVIRAAEPVLAAPAEPLPAVPAEAPVEPAAGEVVYVDEQGRPVAPPSASSRSWREDDDEDEEHERDEHHGRRRWSDDD